MRLIPRDEGFFELFAELARHLTAAAKLLNQLFTEPQRLRDHIAAIKDVEHTADGVTREIVQRIDKSFITPIDREDIHMLASKLDNAIDLIDGTARRAGMYHIAEIREPAKLLSGVVVRAAQAIETAVVDMRRPAIVRCQGELLKQLEEEGDAIYQDAVGALFTGSPDPLDVIRWKDVYDTLEDTVDECEDVADVLESIVLKNG